MTIFAVLVFGVTALIILRMVAVAVQLLAGLTRDPIETDKTIDIALRAYRDTRL